MDLVFIIFEQKFDLCKKDHGLQGNVDDPTK